MDVNLKVNTMKNLSAELDILKTTDSVEVGECSELDFAISLPGPISVGSLISAECTLEISGKRHKLPITGKVHSCNKIQNGQFHVRVRLGQYEKSLWDAMLAMHRSNQVEADRLFRAVKGED